MSAGHMPEPWLVDSDNCHAGQIATLHGDDEGYAEIWSMHWPYNPHNSQFANARRIVSCVNALEGLNQYDLDSGWNFKNADARLTAEEIKNDRLKALNAELVSALEVFANKYDAAPDGDLGIGLVNGDFARARAALAKQKETA